MRIKERADTYFRGQRDRMDNAAEKMEDNNICDNLVIGVKFLIKSEDFVDYISPILYGFAINNCNIGTWYV